MNQWMLIRRMRGPAYLVLIGIMFLLGEWHVIAFWRSWPLLLILAGVFSLAERAALSRVDPTHVGGSYGGPGTYPASGNYPAAGNYSAPGQGYGPTSGAAASPAGYAPVSSTALSASDPLADPLSDPLSGSSSHHSSDEGRS